VTKTIFIRRFNHFNVVLHARTFSQYDVFAGQFRSVFEKYFEINCLNGTTLRYLYIIIIIIIYGRSTRTQYLLPAARSAIAVEKHYHCVPRECQIIILLQCCRATCRSVLPICIIMLQYARPFWKCFTAGQTRPVCRHIVI